MVDCVKAKKFSEIVIPTIEFCFRTKTYLIFVLQLEFGFSNESERKFEKHFSGENL